MSNVWEALMFMAIGAALMWVANCFGWRKYHEGRNEGRQDGHRDVQREVVTRQRNRETR